MKKILYLLFALVLSITSFGVIGCNPPQKEAVKLKYYADASQIVPMILGGSETIGLIPEPAATTLQTNATKQGKTLYRLDLQELYDSNTKAYPQAVLMVKKSVLGNHANVTSVLEQKITESVVWAKQNVGSAVTAIANHGATTLDATKLTEQAIDGCKIYWQGAEQSKTQVQAYVNGIINVDSASATAVNDDFFYTTSSLTNLKQSYTFVAPDGAPALAISKLMNDQDALGTQKDINYQVVTAGEIRTALVTGGADFILAPVNMASKLYKQCDENDHYVMVAVVTHGNFYIISTERISVNDLAGKQIAVPMKGAVPDWTLQMVLKKHNLTYQTVE